MGVLIKIQDEVWVDPEGVRGVAKEYVESGWQTVIYLSGQKVYTTKSVTETIELIQAAITQFADQPAFSTFTGFVPKGVTPIILDD